MFVCAAPIRGLFLELSRLSGYEEMKCSVHDVFPAPRVTWTTEPPTFEDLRPVTRMQADKTGLYSVDSRLKRLKGRPDLIYICKVTSAYGGPAWTASLIERGKTCLWIWRICLLNVSDNRNDKCARFHSAVLYVKGQIYAHKETLGRRGLISGQFYSILYLTGHVCSQRFDRLSAVWVQSQPLLHIFHQIFILLVQLLFHTLETSSFTFQKPIIASKYAFPANRQTTKVHYFVNLALCDRKQRFYDHTITHFLFVFLAFHVLYIFQIPNFWFKHESCIDSLFGIKKLWGLCWAVVFWFLTGPQFDACQFSVVLFRCILFEVSALKCIFSSHNRGVKNYSQTLLS